MKFGILAHDKSTAGDSDESLYSVILVVNRNTREEAYDYASSLAEENDLEVEACHDGCACYEVVQDDEELKDALVRLRQRHNALLDLHKVTE